MLIHSTKPYIKTQNWPLPSHFDISRDPEGFNLAFCDTAFIIDELLQSPSYPDALLEEMLTESKLFCEAPFEDTQWFLIIEVFPKELTKREIATLLQASKENVIRDTAKLKSIGGDQIVIKISLSDKEQEYIKMLIKTEAPELCWY